jgi:hypothetical protein
MGDKKTGRKPVGKGKKKKHPPHPSRQVGAQKREEKTGTEGGAHGEQAGTQEPEV